MTCTADHCETPTADGIHLCEIHEKELWDLLGRIPETLADARDTVARLDRKGQAAGGGGSGHSDGINLEALDDVIALQGLLGSWAQMLLEETQVGHGEEPVAYLRARLREVVRQDWAGEMLDELTEAHRKVEGLVDVRRETIILRTCGTLLEDGTHCESKLKLRDKGQGWVQCHWCGSWFAVEAVRRELARKARGEPMTQKGCRAFLASQTGVQIAANDLKNWARLRHVPYVLARVNTAGRDERLYFPGDVLTVSRRMSERRAA